MADRGSQVELRRVWVRNFKSLRDFSLDVGQKLTAVAGPSGSGKTSLVEVFELWRDVVEYARGNAFHPLLKWWSFEHVVWRGDASQPVVLGLELSAADMHIRYELELYRRDVANERVVVEKGGTRLEHASGAALRRVMLSAVCAEKPVSANARLLIDAVATVCRFAGGFVALKELNYAELRKPQRPERQTRLLPDASNLVPLLLQLTGGRPTPQLEETLRRLGYASMSFPVTEDGRIYLKLMRADGTAVAQHVLPSSVFKTLALETALMLKPTLVAVDSFECGLDPDLQLYLLDRLADSGAYVFIATNSEAVIRRIKKTGKAVELMLEGGETRTSSEPA